MWRWAWKTLLGQRTGLFGSGAGVAGAFVLVICFEAVFTGISEDIVTYIRHTDADVWVMQRGVSNMHMANSFVWDWKADRVAEVPGVADVNSILYLNSVVKAGNRDRFAYVVGLRPDARRGGPWALAAGRGMPAQGEAVIPDVMAKISGLNIGDEISITDKSLRVVGLSEGTFSMANSVVFVHLADLEDILSAFGSVSYILVAAQPGVDSNELARRIEQQVEKVSALPREKFIASDFQIAMHMGVEIIALMTVVGTALAILIIAFTSYSHVAKKRRELAIAKALGFRNSAIYGGVAVQTSAITLLGLLLAVAFAYTIMPQISQLMPQVTLIVTFAAIAKIGLLALGVAILASFVPAYLVTRVDPLSAFHV